MSELYVLDASAILAFLRDEPGKERVEGLLGSSLISAVNLSEVAAKLCEYGMPPEKVTIALAELLTMTIGFDEPQALIAGALRKQTRAKGLSLGDRACLALAQVKGRTAMTADRAWGDLDVEIPIEVIR